MTTPTPPLSALQWGSGGPTFVFLHYFGGSAESWRWVAQDLADCRCVALNLPGFGGTPALERPSLAGYADAVAKTLNQLQLEDYTLVGHSMGGKIALQVAVTSACPPQQVALIAPSPPTQEPMPAEEKDRLLHNHPSIDNAKTTIANATHQSLTEDQYEVALKTHLDVAPTAWRWWLLEGMDHSIAERVSALQTPATVLASQDDPVIPYDTIERDVREVLPQAQLIPTAGVGHLLPLEAPAWVASQLRQLA